MSTSAEKLLRLSGTTNTRYCITFICTYLVCACLHIQLFAQHIPVTNPTLSGTPQMDATPAGWVGMNTADVQPGIYGVRLAAAEGNSYVGLHSGNQYTEGISQQLNGVLRKDHIYSMYFDLAYAAFYAYSTCYGNLAIYGGHAPGDTAELLWSSGEFIHTTWQRYSPLFSPSADYTYITLCAYHASPCSKSDYGVAVLLDNISNFIYEQLKLSFSTTTTCANSNTGAILLTVAGGTPPFNYSWGHGAPDNNQLRQLPAGTYTVTVTDSKGITAEGSTTVQTSDLAADATVTPSRCSGEQNGQIAINASGGLPPYRYYVNNNNASYTPVLEHLPPAAYQVIVKDEQGCMAVLPPIALTEPPPLKIREAIIKPCSCSETQNGKIIPLMQGGTPPYAYRINGGMWQPDSLMGQLQPGFYQYEIQDHNGCSVSGSGEITSPFKNCIVVLPTAFSPNGDGSNDLFRAKIYDDVRNYSLRVYNRWGALIFQTNDPEKGWDGMYKGILQQAQGYLYICTFTDRNNVPQQMSGNVTLVH
ncbi:T9SS type B sorting domain-containing protein [Chitinophaga rupis]|uniref:T9SS type B sorting domain-containing protein n=1 Tax=Chitinophaga rupis TaxID=573321 RepID=UPI000B7F4AD7|nr:gliding motility-associated C-terminal domain-containing protein [Chitinophaga rupis]